MVCPIKPEKRLTNRCGGFFRGKNTGISTPNSPSSTVRPSSKSCVIPKKVFRNTSSQSRTDFFQRSQRSHCAGCTTLPIDMKPDFHALVGHYKLVKHPDLV